MKEHNPDNPILHEAVNGSPAHPPSSKTPGSSSKKRDHEVMLNGFQGDSTGARGFPIPKPTLERDFQMSVQLNPKINVGPGIWGQREWVSFVSGHWNGRWGKGTVVVRSTLILETHTSPFPFPHNHSQDYQPNHAQPGGQDSQLVAPDLSTHLSANYLLQTHDHPPAYIAVKTEGWRVGPRDILEKLMDPAQADEVDPKLYSYRINVSMETGDGRYLHLNTGMWVGSGIRRGGEGEFICFWLSFGGVGEVG